MQLKDKMISQYENINTIKKKFKKLDTFGTQPSLSVKNEKNYSSYTGTFLSIVLYICLIIACWVYGRDMIFRRNPTATFAEEQVRHPNRFDIKKDTMNIAFGMSYKNQTTGISGYYYDPSIYTVNIQQEIETTYKDSDGQIKTKKVEIDLDVRPCTMDSIEIDKKFWTGLQEFEQLNCIHNYNDIYIEGNHGQEVFSEIEGNIYPCKNETSKVVCKSPEVINEALKDSYWGFYTSDMVVDPTNHSAPFTRVGRSQYGVASNQLYRKIDFYFKNVAIEDNTGIIFDKIEQQRGIQFDYEKEFLQNQPKKSGQFLKFSIRFSSVRHTRIFRRYLTLVEAFAKVGGILKILSLVFLIITGIMTVKGYNHYLVKSVFQYDRPCQSEVSTNGEMKSNEQRKKEQQKNEELEKYAIHKINNILNLENLVVKLFDIEKLKLLLLNEEQRKVFNLTEKPYISNKIIEGDLSYNKKQKEESEKQHQWQTVYEDTRSAEDRQKEGLLAFKNLLEINSENPTYINSKLISLIDPGFAKNLSKKHRIEIQELQDDDEEEEEQEQKNQQEQNLQNEQVMYPQLINGELKQESERMEPTTYRGEPASCTTLNRQGTLLGEKRANRLQMMRSCYHLDHSYSINSLSKNNQTSFVKLLQTQINKVQTKSPSNKISNLDDVSVDLNGSEAYSINKGFKQQLEHLNGNKPLNDISMQLAQNSSFVDIAHQPSLDTIDTRKLSHGTNFIAGSSPTRKKNKSIKEKIIQKTNESMGESINNKVFAGEQVNLQDKCEISVIGSSRRSSLSIINIGSGQENNQ